MADFKMTGFDKTIKAISRLENCIPKAKKEIEYTMNEARNIAQQSYDAALYDGVNDAKVAAPKWVSKTKIELRASGYSLLFIECGAGIRYLDPPSYVANRLGYYRGNYGKGLATKRGGLWIYKTPAGNELNGIDGGRVLRRDGSYRTDVAWSGGNPATNGMYYALRYLQNYLVSNIIRAGARQ